MTSDGPDEPNPFRNVYWTVEKMEYPDGGVVGYFVRWADTAEEIARCHLEGNAKRIVAMHNTTIKLS